MFSQDTPITIVSVTRNEWIAKTIPEMMLLNVEPAESRIT